MVNTTPFNPCNIETLFNSTPSGPMVKRQQNEISTPPIRVEGQAISASSCPIKPKIIGFDFSGPGEGLLRDADVACKGRAPVFPWNTKPLELWMRADEHGIGRMGFQPGKRQWGEVVPRNRPGRLHVAFPLQQCGKGMAGGSAGRRNGRRLRLPAIRNGFARFGGGRPAFPRTPVRHGPSPAPGW